MGLHQTSLEIYTTISGKVILMTRLKTQSFPVEWFEAAIDAHKKARVYKPKGQKIVSHDPSDPLGDDAKGLCYRHGRLFWISKSLLQAM